MRFTLVFILLGLVLDRVKSHTDEELFALFVKRKSGSREESASIIRTVAMEYYPYCFLDSGSGQWRGAFFDLMAEAARSINASLQVTRTAGRFSQMADVVAAGSVDAAGLVFSMTAARMEHMDFTTIVYRDAATLHQSQNAMGVNEKLVGIGAFFKAFHSASWMSILVLTPIAIASYWLTSDASLSKACETILILFLQRSADVAGNNASSRVAFLTANACFFFLYSLYAGLLTSVMVAKEEPPSYANWQDLLDADVKLYLMENTAFQDAFLESESDSAMRKVYGKVLDESRGGFYQSLEEGIAKTVENPHSVMFESSLAVKTHTSNVRPVEGFLHRIVSNYAFALAENSKWKNSLDRSLRQIEEQGWKKRIMGSYGVNDQANMEEVEEEESESLDMRTLMFPFSCLLIGMLTSIVFMMKEKMS